MKGRLFLCFLALSALCFAVRPLSIEEARALVPQIEVDTFSITCYGTRYAVEKEWQGAPRIHFLWDSQTGYENLVEHVFEEAGYLKTPAGETFRGKILSIGEDFIYWEFSFRGKLVTNRDAVVRKDERLPDSIWRFCALHYGLSKPDETGENKSFSYLVLLKNRQPYEPADPQANQTSVLLLEGQGFSIWKFSDTHVRLKPLSTQKASERPVWQFAIAPVPVQAIDLEDAFFPFTLETRPPGLLARLDGVEYETPFSAQLPQGVHRLEIAGEERFFYLSEPTTQFLEIEQPQGTLSIELSLTARIALYRDRETVFITQSATRVTQTLPFGFYTLKVQREAYEPIEETVEVLPGKRVTKSYSLTPIPGAVFLKRSLDQPCERIFVNERWAILADSTRSVFMPLPTNDATAFYLEERVAGAEGPFSYSLRTVYLGEAPIFLNPFPIVTVVPFDKELWIFDASGTLTVVNTRNNKTLWQRAVGYIPHWTYRYDRWLALLDIYGNFILLEPQRGYHEVFRYRFGALKTLDHVVVTPSALLLYFSPDALLTYSFNTRAYHYEEGVSYEPERILLSTNGFQKGRDLFYRFEEPLRAYDISDGHIAVLYDRYYAVLFAPGE